MELRTPDQIEIDALKAEITQLLNQCTEKQRENFHRFYPDIGQMNHERLRNIIGLCQRTIRKTLTGDMYGDVSRNLADR